MPCAPIHREANASVDSSVPSHSIWTLGLAVHPEPWLANLTAVLAAEAAAISGFFVSYALIPIFLTQSLGVPAGGRLAYWSGLATGLSGLCAAMVSPGWGALADRIGRKRILLAAMIAGGLSVTALAFAKNPEQVVMICIVQGASGGTVAIATALIATGSPTSRMSWALGMLSASLAAGGIIGPIIGSTVASHFGFHAAFAIGGALYLTASLIVVVFVTQTERHLPALTSALVLLGPHRRIVRVVAVLVVCQVLLAMSYVSALQLVLVRIAEIMPATAALGAGLMYAGFGIAAFVSGVSYSTLVTRIGFRHFAAASAVGIAAAIALTASPFMPLLFLFAGPTLAGLLYGGLSPALSSMIGLTAPKHLHATAYSFSASATALGIGLGPLVSARVGLSWGVQAAQIVACSFALVLALVLSLNAWESKIDP